MFVLTMGPYETCFLVPLVIKVGELHGLSCEMKPLRYWNLHIFSLVPNFVLKT